jgi:hypothetical protein
MNRAERHAGHSSYVEQMEVIQGKFGTAVIPEDSCLETIGLSTCIGVAVISNQRGFLLHINDPGDSETDALFQAFDRFIPSDLRSRIRPILFGAVIEDIFHDENDADIRRLTIEFRNQIKDRLCKAGFGTPRLLWAQAGQTHSMHLDLAKGTAELEIDDRIAEEKLDSHFITF